MKLSVTAEKAIQAYGGTALWNKARTIETILSANGLAFTLKRRPAFERAKFTTEIHRPFARMTPIGKETGVTGVLDGADVRLENSSGEILEERKNARSYFPFGRRLFYWDDLDMTYFANYATWNYLTLPALLMNDAITWTEKRPGFLEGIFPDSIPTHNRVQTFEFDVQSGLLLQHNYAPAIISKFANAANVVKEHSQGDGALFTSHRIVTPQGFGGKPMGGPVLIDLRIHDFQI
ncbi:MAG TPA: hypothetical protein PLB73_17130, partial [Leptospiraceae bacterium]|nr:hypothetical protein [Leptospiraceae bacterium]